MLTYGFLCLDFTSLEVSTFPHSSHSIYNRVKRQECIIVLRYALQEGSVGLVVSKRGVI
jgi:hypothetical protein